MQMDEHLVVNQLTRTETAMPCQQVPQNVECGHTQVMGCSSSTTPEGNNIVVVVHDGETDKQAPPIRIGECRICQEEDSFNNLESPCACSGSLKYAHRKCVQYWCNEKGDITCEICHQPYQPGYSAPPRPISDETSIEIRDVWPLDMHDTQLLTVSEVERRLANFDDYNGVNTSGTTFCRSAALILMALLLLRHALSLADDGDVDGDQLDDVPTFLSLLLLRAVGFLLPCYIMIWAINILQRRRQRQEAAALATARLAIVFQAAQSRGLLIASGAPAIAPWQANPHLEPV